MLEKIFFKSTEQMFKKEMLFNEIFSNPIYFQKEKFGLKAIVVDLSPYDYMDVVKAFKKEHKTEKAKLDSLRKAYESNIKVTMPYLIFGERDSCLASFGQEGYNRAYSSTMIRKETIPVAIRYRENDETIPSLVKDAITLSELKIKVFISGYISDDRASENRLGNVYLRRLITGNRRLIDKLDEDKKLDFLNDIYASFELGVKTKYEKKELPFYLEYEVEKFKFYQSVMCVQKLEDKDYVVQYHNGNNSVVDIDELRSKIDYKDIDLLTEHLSDNEVNTLKYDYLGGIESAQNSIESKTNVSKHKFAKNGR